MDKIRPFPAEPIVLPDSHNFFHPHTQHLRDNARRSLKDCDRGMQAAIRHDDRMLRRIAATLIALAILAERAGGRSFPVRLLALCFLRPAEAIAREFVAEVMHARRLAGAAAIGNDLEHAVRLAMRFRALAAALGAVLRLACRSAGPDARIDGAARRLAPCPGQLTAGGWKQGPHDTS